ncbi:MAG: hypothetical protein D6718_13250 [Acidobacteria bacterium]|nr:MAG: hypothetical protein D6718_13250 [Acidobacteriota bacterium]
MNERQDRSRPACPSCGAPGWRVPERTLRALVRPERLARAGGAGPFRFCPVRGCPVVYFPESAGDVLTGEALSVTVFQKSDDPKRPVCYCFGHTVEEIEREVAATGRSAVPDSIAEKCRRGLDRCEETNPQGRCCLGNVRAILRAATGRLGNGDEGRESCSCD